MHLLKQMIHYSAFKRWLLPPLLSHNLNFISVSNQYDDILNLSIWYLIIHSLVFSLKVEVTLCRLNPTFDRPKWELKIYLEFARKVFIPHTRRPELVLSTALKRSARMGNVWHPCHTHKSNTGYLTIGQQCLRGCFFIEISILNCWNLFEICLQYRMGLDF